MRGGKSKQGFTLIELSFSIVFIAVLSIAVALIVTNAISAYHRGIVLNEINTTGMELVDDMRAAVQSSQSRSLIDECTTRLTDDSACVSDRAQKWVSLARYTAVTRGSTSIGTVPVYGVFCTGNYSYIWNSGYFFSSDGYTFAGGINRNNKATLTYRRSSDGRTVSYSNEFRLLKVKDDDRSVCMAAAGTTYNYTTSNMPNKIDISGESYGAVEEEPIEILPNNGMLALYDLKVPAPAINGAMNSMFYSVSFILGTVEGGVNVTAKNNNCVAPEDYANGSVENFDYCAINKFNFAAQANGG